MSEEQQRGFSTGKAALNAALGLAAGLGLLWALNHFDISIRPNSQLSRFSYTRADGVQTEVIRQHIPLLPDKLYVGKQGLTNETCYVTLGTYLKSMPNNYDRNIEESRIKKIVSW